MFILKKLNNLSGKKFSDRFVGDISKTILDLGFDNIFTLMVMR